MDKCFRAWPCVVAMPDDPSADIHQTEKVFFVMKDGIIYRNDREQRMRGAGASPGGGL